MKKLFFTLTVFSLFATGVFAQAGKFKAMYIYNFSRLVEWPETYRSGDFVIGVLGRTDVYDEITSFTSNKKAGSQDIVIEKYNSVEEISKCNILFISDSEARNMASIVGKLQGKNTLLIGENERLVDQGAAISFVIQDGKLKYMYKGENARKYGLKVSTSLENMAIASN